MGWGGGGRGGGGGGGKQKIKVGPQEPPKPRSAKLLPEPRVDLKDQDACSVYSIAFFCFSQEFHA